MSNYTFSLYESFSPDLKIKWDKFESEYGWSPFQNFSWLKSWYNEIGIFSNILPKIVLVEYGKQVIAIFPLSIRINLKINILEWMGGIYADYKGPIINSSEKKFCNNFLTIWKSINELIGKYDLIYFDRQPMFLNKIYNPILLIFPGKFDIYSYKMKVEKLSWQSFYDKKVKKKHQADSNRQIKRLTNLGDIKFVVAEDVEMKTEIVDKMIKFKRIKYKDNNTYDFLKSNYNRNFFKSLPNLEDDNINVHFSALTLNNEIISTHVGIKWFNKFYYLMPSNENIKYKSFSTGRLLLEKLIRDSVIEGNEYFDFTIGSEEYKKTWCDLESVLYKSNSYTSIKGFCYLKLSEIRRSILNNKVLKPFLKKLYQIYLRCF